MTYPPVPLHLVRESQLPHATMRGSPCDGDCLAGEADHQLDPMPEVFAALSPGQADVLYAVAVRGLSIREYARLEGVDHMAALRRYRKALARARAILEAK